MKFSSYYRFPILVVMMLIMPLKMNNELFAAPSRFDVMRTLKWKVVDVLEQNLHGGLLTQEQKAITEYTIYKIKSSIGQFTNKEYFEDLYYQTYQLVKIKTFLTDSNHRNTVDNLLEFYQVLLKEMYTERGQEN
jgi:hypothetical protein